MELKPFCCLLFTLLSASFYTSVSSGTLGDSTQFPEIVYYEGIQEKTVNDIVDRKLEPLYKTISELKDTMNAQMELIAALEFKLNQLNAATEKAKASKHATNITKDVTEKINKVFMERTIINSMLTAETNLKIDKMKNELQKDIFEKLDAMENNRNKDMKELTDKLNSVINNQEVVSVTTELAQDSTTIPNTPWLCNLKIPRSVEIRHDIWYTNDKPEEGALDSYMAIRTGCTYRGQASREDFSMPTVVYNGDFEWYGAVRASENGDVVVRWADHAGYAFYFGVDDNMHTVFYQRRPWLELERLATPGILAADTYVPFYIKIKAGTLTFGKLCEGGPLFTLDVAIERGDLVMTEFYPFSRFGGKHLYSCPASVGGPA